MGTYGSRSIAVGGTAIVKALDKIIAKGKKIAAHLLEASESDIEYDRGEFKVAGTDRKKTFGEVAFAAYVPHNYPHDKLEPGLNENAFYDPANFTFPAGTYVCEVEVDQRHRHTQIVAFTAVDDFGKIINPMIVEGQVHGGITQGIGQALTEGCRYEASGQLVTGSFMDYCIPRASRRAALQDRHARDAVHAQPARREGLRRGRRDRRARGGDECHHRRAGREGRRHAGDGADGLEASPGEKPCTRLNTTGRAARRKRSPWARRKRPGTSPAGRAWCRR